MVNVMSLDDYEAIVSMAGVLMCLCVCVKKQRQKNGKTERWKKGECE